MSKRQKPRLVAYCSDTANSLGVRVALAFEYDMEKLVTGNGYTQTNIVIANMPQMMRAQLAGGGGSSQLQLTPMLGRVQGMALHTPTAARAALSFGGGTGLSNPGRRG